jgi:hypothetical protein
MLILELGNWIIPMMLIFAPCRRLVLLVAKLQHHAHKVIIASNMEPYSKDTNAEHDAVKEAWK